VEELTRSDKNQIEKIAKAQAKKYFEKEISNAIDKELGRSYFGRKGKVNKFVDDAITQRFKSSAKDKDFDEAVIKVAKRVLKGLHDMHYKRNNLIDQMPVPKN
jgi:isocitrate dehydrogenase